MSKGTKTGKLANLFNRKKPQPQTKRLDMTSCAAFASFGSLFGGDPYANDIYRGAVDAIARLTSKLMLQPVITFSDGTTSKCDDKLTRLLQVEPNPMMTAYDLLYMATTHLYTRNNAYILIFRNEAGEPTGLYPMHVRSCEFQVDVRGTIYCHFTFDNGKQTTFLYSDVIHLRRHFNSADINGDCNDAIRAGLELADAQNKGIVASINNGANLRGILHYTQIMSTEKMKQNTEEFVSTFMSMNNTGGIAALDQSMEYTPLETRDVTISSEDQRAVKDKIYNYLGVSEKIVNATYTDDEFGAFNESVIEPFSLQVELEFTRKLFTPMQVARGRVIRVMNARLQYMSNANKVNLLQQLVPMGIITINEARELMGMPPSNDDDRRIQSLNYASVDIVDKYQLVRAKDANYSLKELLGDTEEADEGTVEE